MDAELEGAVIAEIAAELGMEPGDVSRASRLAEDLGVDSLDGLELMLRMEDRFGVRPTDAEAASLRSVGDVVDMVGRQKQGPTEPAG